MYGVLRTALADLLGQIGGGKAHAVILLHGPGDAPVFIGAEGDQERCRDHEAGKYKQNEDKIYGMTVCLLSHKLPPASRPEKLFPELSRSVRLMMM